MFIFFSLSCGWNLFLNPPIVLYVREGHTEYSSTRDLKTNRKSSNFIVHQEQGTCASTFISVVYAPDIPAVPSWILQGFRMGAWRHPRSRRGSILQCQFEIFFFSNLNTQFDLCTNRIRSMPSGAEMRLCRPSVVLGFCN